MDEEKLISAVRLRNFIYNKNDKRHADRDVVAAAWENIAKEVGENVTAADCKNRWGSLRDHFRKKHREMSTAVSGQAAKKRRKWYLYDFLTFLIPSCSTGPTSSNLPNPDQDDLDENESSDDQTQETQSQNTQSSRHLPSDDDSLRPNVTPLRKKRPTRCSGKKNGMSDIDKEVINAFREVQNEVPMDENEHFLKSLMPVMRTLDVMQALELRGEIQKLVISFVKSAKTQATETHAQQTFIPSPQTSTSTSGAAQFQLQQSQQQPYYMQDHYFTQRAYSP